MGPPNSVAIASPLPNTYFGDVYGAVAHFPSSFQFHGSIQPFIPAANYDVDSTGRTLPPFKPEAPKVTTILDRWRTAFQRSSTFGLPAAIENPLSWWQRQLPGIPERGM